MAREGIVVMAFELSKLAMAFEDIEMMACELFKNCKGFGGYRGDDF